MKIVIVIAINIKNITKNITNPTKTLKKKLHKTKNCVIFSFHMPAPMGVWAFHYVMKRNKQNDYKKT